MARSRKEAKSDGPPHQQPAFIPTPEEIREACKEIQADWPAWKERERRVSETPWFPPGMRNANVMPRHDDG